MDFTDAFQDPDYFKLSDEEAAFGFSEIAGIIARQARPGLRCLEIGSGPGLLLGRLQSHFPDCRFEGIEPVGSGFGKTEAPLAIIAARADLTIHRCGYEDFTPKQPYDVIFSINVFEHVGSWRHYLTRIHELLAPGGVAVILCPNYAFPWEPHFRLPIFLTKSLTHRLFARRIADFEQNQDYHGLWASLNFVKKGQVLRFAKGAHLAVRSDETVMRRMFQRLFTDPAFAGRQRALAGIAKLFYRLGLTRVLEMPGVRLFSPFMALRMSK
jgi:SAM-dependent methyltransferase